MAIYITWRDRLHSGHKLNAVALWKCNVKARLKLVFCFHETTGNLSKFLELWGFEGVLCSISEERAEVPKYSSLSFFNCLCYLVFLFIIFICKKKKCCSKNK